jgi:hypothetical protein
MRPTEAIMSHQIVVRHSDKGNLKRRINGGPIEKNPAMGLAAP